MTRLARRPKRAPAVEEDLVIPREALRRRLPPPPDPFVTWTGPHPARMIVDGDNHFSVTDPYLQAAKLKFAADVKPSVWVNLGDQYDFDLLGKFAKDPARAFPTIQSEFDAAAPYWSEVARIAKVVHFLQGNHEFRLYKTLMANPGLFGLRALEWSSLAGLPDSVQVHPYGSHLQAGLAWIEHGDQIKGGQYPSRWALDNRGGRVLLFGHGHRMTYHARTVRGEDGQVVVREAYGQGHGAAMAGPDYPGPLPPWQQSFTFVEHFTVAGRPAVQVTPIRVNSGRFSYGGKLYDGHRG